MGAPGYDPIASTLLGWLTLWSGLLLVLAVSQRHPKLVIILLTAFALRASFALVHYYIIPLPDSGKDAATFERVAWEWSQGGLSQAFTHFTTGAYLYSWLISLVYSVTERSPLMAQGINVLFGTLIVWNVYRISLLLWGERIAKRSAWLTTVFPLLVLYSAITMREVAVVYPLTLGALYLVRWYGSLHPLHLALALISFAVSLAFHTAVLVVFISLAVLLGLSWVSMSLKPKRFARYSVAMVLVATVLAIVMTSGWGLEKISGNIHVLYDLERLTERQEILTSGRAQYPESLIIQAPQELIWKTPLRVIYLLFTPFPWIVETALDGLGLINVAFNLLVAGLLFHNLRRIRANSGASALLLILVLLLLVFALNTSNYGTAARHAAKLVPLAACLVIIPPLARKSLE